MLDRPTVLTIIPARLASTRLPGKPLADIAGQPMIVHVMRRAQAAAVGAVVIATDSEAIAACVEKAGGRAVMTRAALRRWVDYARAEEAVIVYDAAYEAYIRDPELPHSIYEVEGAREVAIESRSFSKNAGFTEFGLANHIEGTPATSNG